MAENKKLNIETTVDIKTNEADLTNLKKQIEGLAHTTLNIQGFDILKANVTEIESVIQKVTKELHTLEEEISQLSMISGKTSKTYDAQVDKYMNLKSLNDSITSARALMSKASQNTTGSKKSNPKKAPVNKYYDSSVMDWDEFSHTGKAEGFISGPNKRQGGTLRSQVKSTIAKINGARRDAKQAYLTADEENDIYLTLRAENEMRSRIKALPKAKPIDASKPYIKRSDFGSFAQGTEFVPSSYVNKSTGERLPIASYKYMSADLKNPDNIAGVGKDLSNKSFFQLNEIYSKLETDGSQAAKELMEKITTTIITALRNTDLSDVREGAKNSFMSKEFLGQEALAEGAVPAYRRTGSLAKELQHRFESIAEPIDNFNAGITRDKSSGEYRDERARIDDTKVSRFLREEQIKQEREESKRIREKAELSDGEINEYKARSKEMIESVLKQIQSIIEFEGSSPDTEKAKDLANTFLRQASDVLRGSTAETSGYRMSGEYSMNASGELVHQSDYAEITEQDLKYTELIDTAEKSLLESRKQYYQAILDGILNLRDKTSELVNKEAYGEIASNLEKQIAHLSSPSDKTIQQNLEEAGNRIANILTRAKVHDVSVERYASLTGRDFEEVQKQSFGFDKIEGGKGTAEEWDKVNKVIDSYSTSKTARERFDNALKGNLENLDKALEAFFSVRDDEIQEVYNQVAQLKSNPDLMYELKAIVANQVLEAGADSINSNEKGNIFSTISPKVLGEQGVPAYSTLAPKDRFIGIHQGQYILGAYGAKNNEEALDEINSRIVKIKERQAVADDKIVEAQETYYRILEEYNSRTTKTGTRIDWQSGLDEAHDYSPQKIADDKKAFEKAKRILKDNTDFQASNQELALLESDKKLVESAIEQQKQIYANAGSSNNKIAQLEVKKQEIQQKEEELIQEKEQVIEVEKEKIEEIKTQTNHENLAGISDKEIVLTYSPEQTNDLENNTKALENHIVDMNGAVEAEKSKLAISEQLTKQLKAELEALEALNKAFIEHGEVVNIATTTEKVKGKSSAKKAQQYQEESEVPFNLGDGYDDRQKQAQRDLNEQNRNEAIAEMRRPDYQSKLDRGTASQIGNILEQDPAYQRDVLNERDAFSQYQKYLQEQIKLVEQSEKIQALKIQNQQRINELSSLTNKSAQEEIEKLQQQNNLYDQQLADINKLYDAASLSKQYTGLLDAAQGKGDRILNPYSVARLKQINETGERNAEEAIISGRISAQQQIQENSLKQQNSLVSSYLSNYEKMAQLLVNIINLQEKGEILEGNALAENQAQLEKAQQQYEAEERNLEVFNEEALTLNNMTLTAENLARIRERTAQIDAESQATIAINSAKNTTLADKTQGKEAKNNISQYLSAFKRNNAIEQQIARTNKAMEGQTGSALANSKQIVTALQEQQIALNNIINGYDREHGILNGIQLTDEQRVSLNRDIDNLQASQAAKINTINGLQSKQVGFLDKLASGFKQQLTYLIDMSLAYQAVGKVRQMIQQIITQTQELDSSIVDIQIATGMTREETRALLLDYTAMADKLGRSTKDIANAANDWLRAGYEGAEAAKLTEASMMLSTLGMIESSEATTYLISTLKGWKLSAEEVIGVVDRLSVRI